MAGSRSHKSHLAPSQGRVCVGAFAGAHGVKGAVRLKSFCAVPEAIAEYGLLKGEDPRQSYDLKIEKRISGGLLARVQGISTREQAEALRGMRLYLERDKLPETGEDEFYHADLIGLEARDPGGAVLGKIAAVLDHGAGDLLEIRHKGKKSALVPFSHQVVPHVDLSDGFLIVDPPDGLLDE